MRGFITHEINRTKTIERLFSRIEPVAFLNENDCWNWIGSRDKDGYGNTTIGSRKITAHRLMYFLYRNSNKRILRNSSFTYIHILHACDNPSCVNPNHLSEGTCKDNKDDCVSKGRHYRADNPENHGKLKTSQVIEIRELHANGETTNSLMLKFNISRAQVCNIISRRQWKNV